MNRWIVLSFMLVAGAANGQKIYKCPGPDGKAVYQQQRCPEGGGRMYVQDNGSSSGATSQPDPPQTRANPPPAPESNGLREGEKEMLRDVRAREEAERDRAAEYAKARAIEAHQQEVRKMSEQMHQDNMMRLDLLKQSLKRR